MPRPILINRADDEFTVAELVVLAVTFVLFLLIALAAVGF